MKGITICLYLLAIIIFHSVQAKPLDKITHEEWRSFARDFATQTRQKMWEMDPRTYTLCFKLKEHDIILEEKLILHNFDSCDDFTINPRDCYFAKEKKFHENIIRAKESTSCMENLCSYWNHQKQKVKKSFRPCFYNPFLETLIEVMSGCSIFQPVVNASRSLNMKIYNKKNLPPVVNMALEKKKNAVRRAENDFEYCRQKVINWYDKNRRRYDDDECLGTSSLDRIEERISKCLSGPIEAFHESIEDAETHLHDYEKADPIIIKLPWAS